MLLPLLLIFILAGDNVFTQNTTEVDQENSEVDEYEELTMMKGMNTISLFLMEISTPSNAMHDNIDQLYKYPFKRCDREMLI